MRPATVIQSAAATVVLETIKETADVLLCRLPDGADRFWRDRRGLAHDHGAAALPPDAGRHPVAEPAGRAGDSFLPRLPTRRRGLCRHARLARGIANDDARSRLAVWSARLRDL